MAIVILQNKILDYRLALYNGLNKKADVTVIHCGDAVTGAFTQIRLTAIRVGPIFWVRGLKQALAGIDVDFIIAMGDMRWPQYFFIGRTNRYKCCLWGVDSGKSRIIDFLKVLFINSMRVPVIFYSEVVAKRWRRRLSVKTFVAQNSIFVELPSFTGPRYAIVNVGSLVQRKKNELLIDAYACLPPEILRNSRLVFVGDGPEREKLQRRAYENGVADRVVFKGYISDPKAIACVYDTAVVSVSVGQAGLAVSQSIGSGVPFITHSEAISGGEVFGIVEGRTGRFLTAPMGSADMTRQLVELLIDYWNSKDNAAIYRACRDFYDANLSLASQIGVLCDAVGRNSSPE